MNEPVAQNDSAGSRSAKVGQFGLLEMFYTITVYAVGLLLSPWTIVWTSIALAFWWLLVRGKRKSYAGWLLAFITVMWLLYHVMGPAAVQVRGEITCSTTSLNNARQIILSIINYESHRREFPSAYSLDAEGNPNLSWRVHILPTIGLGALHQKFNLNEPWDSPTNKKLIAQMPWCYSCWYYRNTRITLPPGHTPYKLVVGEGTPFEPGRTLNYGDLVDGASNSVGLVEDAANPVPWTKPEDLSVDEAVAVLAVKSFDDVAHARKIKYGITYGGSVVALMDGSTHMIRPGVDPDAVRGWCLVDDGLGFEYDREFNQSLFRAAERQYYVTLGFYLFLLVLPGIMLFYRRSIKSL